MEVHTTLQCLTKPENSFFLFQTGLFFLLTVAAIINISLQTGNIELWTLILTAILGIIVPNPRLKPVKGEEKKENDAGLSQ